MPIRAQSSNSSTLASKSCTDPIVGAILSGWRYDISSISPEMRTDYESHLSDCPQCRHRQHMARRWDVMLISVSTLSIGAFFLAAMVLRRIEALAHLNATYTVGHLRNTPIAISLEWFAIAGLLISMVLWVLVAVATPLPGIVSSDIRQRFTRRHA